MARAETNCRSDITAGNAVALQPDSYYFIPNLKHSAEESMPRTFLLTFALLIVLAGSFDSRYIETAASYDSWVTVLRGASEDTRAETMNAKAT